MNRIISVIIITLCAYFIFLSIYGIKSWFFPSTPIGIASFVFTQIVAILIAFAMYKKTPDKTQTKYGTISKPIGILGVLGLFPSVLWIPAVGFSANMSLMFEANSKIITTVRLIETNSRSCQNKIGFDGISIFMKSSICINAEMIKLYKIGDEVELMVNESILGTRIYSFKKSG